VEDAARKLAEGEKAARRALDLDPNSVDGLIALGFALTEAGKNEEAIPKLRQAVALAPNSELAWDLLGYVYHYAGLDELAEKAYRRSLELDPTTPRIYWMHSRMLLDLGRAREAEQECRQALAIHPNQYRLTAFVADFLYYQGKLDEAKAVLQRALKLEHDSGDEALAIVSGFIYASQGKRGKVNPAVLRQKPGSIIDGDHAYWIGGIHALLGEKQEALAWLRRAIELGNHDYPFFVRDKNYDSLRGDHDYERILADVRARAERYREEFGTSPF